MPEDQINDVWASQALTETLTLPSGQTCVARRIDMNDIISVGMQDQFDTLTAGVMKDHVERVRGPQDHKKPQQKQEEELSDEDLLNDPETVKAGILMFDKLMPAIVVKPVVRSHFRPTSDGKSQEMIPASEREDGVIYTDRIGLEDKVFLFDWAVGGLPNANFRWESVAPVGSMADVQGLQDAAVTPPRTGQNRAARRHRNRGRNRG